MTGRESKPRRVSVLVSVEVEIEAISDALAIQGMMSRVESALDRVNGIRRVHFHD